MRRRLGGNPDDLVPTALKKGWTEPTSLPRKWGGWGWRHVDAKHGWRAADVAATTTALAEPAVPPVPDGKGAVQYIGPEYEQSGAICFRRVVVRDEPRPGTGEPEAPEIVTSYGEYLRAAP